MGHEQDVRCGQAAARTPVGARRQTRPHPGPLADGLRLVVVGGSPCSPCAAGARQICEMPLQAAFAARRSQKSSKRPLSRQQRRAMMALPPARLKQRTRRQSPSLGRRRSRRFPRLGNGRAGRPEPVADAPSAPSVPTSPCPPFGKAKRAVIRLPTSVHDDLVRRRRRGGDLKLQPRLPNSGIDKAPPRAGGAEVRHQGRLAWYAGGSVWHSWYPHERWMRRAVVCATVRHFTGILPHITEVQAPPHRDASTDRNTRQIRAPLGRSQRRPEEP